MGFDTVEVCVPSFSTDSCRPSNTASYSFYSLESSRTRSSNGLRRQDITGEAPLART